MGRTKTVEPEVKEAPEVQEAPTMSERDRKLQPEWLAVIESAQKVVTAMNGNTKKKELDALKKAAKAALSKYNDKVEELFYQDLYAAHPDDFMYEAIKEYDIPEMVNIVYKTNPDTDVSSYEVKKTTRPVDLYNILDTLGGKVFADPKWYNRFESFCKVIAVALNVQLGDSAGFTYDIKEEAKEFGVADINPRDDSSMANVLYKTVLDIVNIGEIESDDMLRRWTFFQNGMTAYAGKGNLNIFSPTHASALVRDVIRNIIHRENHKLMVN